MGFYVSSHPLSSIKDKLPYLATHKIAEIKGMKAESVVTICGLISAARQIPTKKDPSKFVKICTIEDLTSKIETVCFHKKLMEFNDFLQPEQRVIITGKVNYRDDDENKENPSIIVDNVRPVDNCNIMTVELLKDLPYEELVAIKDVMVQNTGFDPVVIKLNDDYVGETKILTSAHFWVNATNDLANKLKNIFPDKVAVSMKSLDEE